MVLNVMCYFFWYMVYSHQTSH